MISEKDSTILEILTEDSKLTTKEISERTGMPITTIHNRIKKMEKEGIIKKYTAVVDKKKLGKSLKAFIQVSVAYTMPSGRHVSQEDLAKKIYQMPEVEECYIMAGTTDILLSVFANDMDDLNNFVINKLRNMEGVQNTLTAIVMNDISRNTKKMPEILSRNFLQNSI